MGKLIDIDKARKEYGNLIDLTMSDTTLLHTLYGVLDNAPTVEAIPKADYETRLKADLVAMLTEIQLEIEELEPMYMDMISPDQVNEVIQKEIDSLEGNK